MEQILSAITERMNREGFPLQQQNEDSYRAATVADKKREDVRSREYPQGGTDLDAFWNEIYMAEMAVRGWTVKDGEWCFQRTSRSAPSEN